MVLVPFFEIHDGFWDKNFAHCCHIHILSHPCLIKSGVLFAWIRYCKVWFQYLNHWKNVIPVLTWYTTEWLNGRYLVFWVAMNKTLVAVKPKNVPRNMKRLRDMREHCCEDYLRIFFSELGLSKSSIHCIST